MLDAESIDISLPLEYPEGLDNTMVPLSDSSEEFSQCEQENNGSSNKQVDENLEGVNNWVGENLDRDTHSGGMIETKPKKINWVKHTFIKVIHFLTSQEDGLINDDTRISELIKPDITTLEEPIPAASYSTPPNVVVDDEILLSNDETLRKQSEQISSNIEKPLPEQQTEGSDFAQDINCEINHNRLLLVKTELLSLRKHLDSILEDKSITLQKCREEIDLVRSRIAFAEADIEQINSMSAKQFTSENPVISRFTSTVEDLQTKFGSMQSTVTEIERQSKRKDIFQFLGIIFLLVVVLAGGIWIKLSSSQENGTQSNASSLVEIAVLYQSVGKNDDAERVLDVAKKTSYTDDSLLGRIGQLYYTIGADKKASDILELVSSKNPKNQLYRLYLARAYSRQNKDQNAIYQYLTLIDLNPTNFTYQLELGNCYENQEKFDLAEEQYLKVIQIIPDRFEGYYNLGQLYRLKMMDYAQAEKQYKKVLEKKPDFYLGQVYYGASLAGLSQYDEAIVQLKKAITLNPEGQSAPLFLGNIYYEKQSYGEALIWYQRVLDYNPNLIAALIGAGQSSAAINDCKTATQHFDNAIRIDPDNQDAQYGVNQCAGQ